MENDFMSWCNRVTKMNVHDTHLILLWLQLNALGFQQAREEWKISIPPWLQLNSYLPISLPLEELFQYHYGYN
jgi:hypothetical protein